MATKHGSAERFLDFLLLQRYLQLTCLRGGLITLCSANQVGSSCQAGGNPALHIVHTPGECSSEALLVNTLVADVSLIDLLEIRYIHTGCTGGNPANAHIWKLNIDCFYR